MKYEGCFATDPSEALIAYEINDAFCDEPTVALQFGNFVVGEREDLSNIQHFTAKDLEDLIIFLDYTKEKLKQCSTQKE